MAKILVTYFSASGVTAKVAEKLAKAAKADLFEIKPEVPYSSADLDWTNKKSRSSVEMADKTSRVAMSDKVENMAQYDTVFVGFPIWWGREPSVVDTFLEAYSFDGKKLVPFCTSGGNDTTAAAKRMRELLGEGVCVDDGKRLGGELSEKDLKLWAEGLGV